MSQRAVAADFDLLAWIARGVRGAGVGLILGLAVFAALFFPEIQAAVQIWSTSTAYNHCFLVIPIVVWLIWDRRDRLRGLIAEPIPMAGLLALPLAAAWLIAERLGIMEGRQLVVLTMIEVLFLAVLGWRICRTLMGPLLYLYFLVPFGEFVTPRLQDFTTWFTGHSLNLLGIPNYIDGYIIQIPEGTFFVAQACAGLRFLIASIAFGVLYALMMYRGLTRRAIFIGLSIVVPIIANGMRATGIVVLGHILGSAQAAATDHIIYGWIFFSFVIVMLILAGLPFREDSEQERPTTTPPRVAPAKPRRGPGLLAAFAVAAAAAIGPLTVLGLDTAAATPRDLALKPLNVAPACRDSGATVSPSPGTIGQSIVQQVDCGGMRFNIQIEVFAARATFGPVIRELRRLTRPVEAEDTTEARVAGNGFRSWRIVTSTEPFFVAAASVWIDGRPETLSMATRFQMARSSVLGGALAPVLVTVVPVIDWSHPGGMDARQLSERINDFLREAPGLSEQVHDIAEAATRRGV
jgi:exosortase A